MAKAPLMKQTAASLQAICASCGLKKTGSKSALVRRLRLAARNVQPLPSHARILSIDLGLKNFAYSLLSPATPPRSELPTKPSSSSPLSSPVHLHAWHRLDLTSPTLTTTKPTTTKPTTTPKSQQQPKKKQASPAEEEETPPEEDVDDKEEAFSPQSLARLATSLVRTHLLPLRPTHVLIERQRFRTGGGAAVSEWTLRVNMLEAMLHAVLAAMSVEGVKGGSGAGRGAGVGGGKGNGSENGSGTGSGRGSGSGWQGQVDSVLPKRVVGFLFPDGLSVPWSGTEGGGDDGVTDGKGKRKGVNAPYQVLKRGKVDLLAAWLRGGEMVVPETAQATEMASLFLEGLDAAGRKKRVGTRKTHVEVAGVKTEKQASTELVTKMDDLSDAVLQGMVWLQWQRNLEKLVQERPELLLDEE